jgi:hypothetical protein
MRGHRALQWRVHLGVTHDLHVSPQHRLVSFSELFWLDADGGGRVQRLGRLSGGHYKSVSEQPRLQCGGNGVPHKLQHQRGLRRGWHVYRRKLRIGRAAQRHELHERHTMSECVLHRQLLLQFRVFRAVPGL